MSDLPPTPDWVFRVDEVSAGVYRVTGADIRGRKVEATGTDPEALLASCRARVREMDVASGSSGADSG